MSITKKCMLLTLVLSAPLVAQVKEVPGEMVTVTATVTATELQSRTLTLRKEDGTHTTVIVPQSYERFPAIKVGDTVRARYYDNVVFRKLNPGETVVDSTSGAIVPTPGSRPGGTASVQQSTKTVVTDIDEAVPSITFSGPNGWKYSSKVKDRNLLKTVKVGDPVLITWTEALQIEVVPPK